jgi:hypothetical protein
LNIKKEKRKKKKKSHFVVLHNQLDLDDSFHRSRRPHVLPSLRQPHALPASGANFDAPFVHRSPSAVLVRPVGTASSADATFQHTRDGAGAQPPALL